MSMNIRTKEDIQISKAMARVLRHKVKEYGLKMNPCGYVPIVALLSCKNGYGRAGLRVRALRPDRSSWESFPKSPATASRLSRDAGPAPRRTWPSRPRRYSSRRPRLP